MGCWRPGWSDVAWAPRPSSDSFTDDLGESPKPRSSLALLPPNSSSDPVEPSPTTRDLVMRFGWNSTSYQILNRGIDHWRPSVTDAPAVVGYVRRRRVIV